jgi:hypothetical protein
MITSANLVTVQLEFIKDCFKLIDEGNFEALKEAGLATIERLEKGIAYTDLYFSFPSDAEITKFISLPENNSPNTREFVQGNAVEVNQAKALADTNYNAVLKYKLNKAA